VGPIVLVGPLADALGTPAVLAGSASLVIIAGVVSIVKAPASADVAHDPKTRAEALDPMTVTTTAQLTRTVQLHYLDAGAAASERVASAVEAPRTSQGPDDPAP
jgi:hypothetical protein